jgi:hypothetical protein
MREQIKQILDEFCETVQFNTDISPEDAQELAADALIGLIKQRNT